MRRRRLKIPARDLRGGDISCDNPGYVGAFSGRHKVRRNWGVAGGGGRTRTYEGLASGFTVRPLCRSGHSPASKRSSLADENAPGLAEADRGLCCLSAWPVNWKYAVDRRAPALAQGSSGSAQPIGSGAPADRRNSERRAAGDLNTERHPYAPSVACHRPSRRRGRRQGSSPRRRRCDRRFRDRQRPRRFR